MKKLKKIKEVNHNQTIYKKKIKNKKIYCNNK
jgi:hypothetical protein